jgi:hypothetical protein
VPQLPQVLPALREPAWVLAGRKQQAPSIATETGLTKAIIYFWNSSFSLLDLLFY